MFSPPFSAEGNASSKIRLEAQKARDLDLNRCKHPTWALIQCGVEHFSLAAGEVKLKLEPFICVSKEVSQWDTWYRSDMCKHVDECQNVGWKEKRLPAILRFGDLAWQGFNQVIVLYLAIEDQKVFLQAYCIEGLNTNWLVVPSLFLRFKLWLINCSLSLMNIDHIKL